MKLRRDVAVRIYGALWMVVGLMLMMKGMPLIVKAGIQKDLPLINFLKPLVGSSEQAALVLVVFGMVLGFIKGKTVLSKAARRSIDRVKGFDISFPVKKIFSARYLVLLGIMMGLGLVLRIFKLPADIHGLIDVAVGCGLINGATFYFRNASASLMVEGTPSNL